jgi:hypothetical protein
VGFMIDGYNNAQWSISGFQQGRSMESETNDQKLMICRILFESVGYYSFSFGTGTTVGYCVCAKHDDDSREVTGTATGCL